MTRVKIVFLILVLISGVMMLQADDQDKKERLVGKFTLQQILDHDKEYADAAFIYIPDPEALAVFQDLKEPVKILLFLRTDCPDCVREVPRFAKIIELAANDNIQVEAVAVNRMKSQPADLVKGWNLELVPTFIVIKDGKEIGRVVEKAEDKLEKDIAKLLKQ